MHLQSSGRVKVSNLICMELLKGILPLIMFTQCAFGQVVVEFPKNRMVVQRDLSNKGQLLVSGFVENLPNSVKVRFLPFANNTGVATAWQDCRIFTKESKTTFFHSQTVTAGWYKMQVHAFKNGVLTDSAVVERVGVGEVFVIAGQSNAQGQANRGSLSSVDEHERVSIILGIDSKLNSQPSFDYYNLAYYFPIYPIGSSSWCWGELGDMLVKKLNVPVMFFNAAWGGSSSENWAQSIDSLSTNEAFRGEVPYHVLKRTLQFYRNTVGFRAVLWHQGEADTYQNQTNARLPRVDYFSNISKVIATSRNQTGEILPWVVSRASFIYNLRDSIVISDQNRLSAEVEKVFRGPYTDTLTNARFDALHFGNTVGGSQGLTKLANSWNIALDSVFFKTAPPLLPDYNKASFVHTDGSVSRPTGYKPASWGGDGESFGFLTDKTGNVYISPLLRCNERRLDIYRMPSHESLNATIGVRKLTADRHITLSHKVEALNERVNASQSVHLKPGFEVTPSTTFLAEINGCY